jgi:hypothetical protein
MPYTLVDDDGKRVQTFVTWRVGKARGRRTPTTGLIAHVHRLTIAQKRRHYRYEELRLVEDDARLQVVVAQE